MLDFRPLSLVWTASDCSHCWSVDLDNWAGGTDGIWPVDLHASASGNYVYAHRKVCARAHSMFADQFAVYRLRQLAVSIADKRIRMTQEYLQGNISTVLFNFKECASLKCLPGRIDF